MSMHEDEYEERVKNLKKSKQGLAIQLSVSMCMSENGQSEQLHRVHARMVVKRKSAEVKPFQ